MSCHLLDKIIQKILKWFGYKEKMKTKKKKNEWEQRKGYTQGEIEYSS